MSSIACIGGRAGAAGCIFGELLQRAVLLPGESEVDQLHKSWALMGTPTPETWPEFAGLVAAKVHQTKTDCCEPCILAEYDIQEL